MLNIIWPLFIIISFVYAILTGRVEQINNSIFESAASAVQLSITFLGTMCLWCGIMQIAKTTTLMQKLTNLLSPVIKLLFPEIKKDDQVYGEISMNMVANILGLGNAATPLRTKSNANNAKAKF
jgi:spore maturation protein A